jgi:hypothetical protein
MIAFSTNLRPSAHPTPAAPLDGGQQGLTPGRDLPVSESSRPTNMPPRHADTAPLGISPVRTAGSPVRAPKVVVAQHASPLFELVDLTKTRADLSRRRELKFVLTCLDLEPLRRLLEGNGQRQIFNGQVSIVRSVYFDDAQRSACRANVDGLSQRSKLRLRWYDSPLPERECYLEIKWRDNRVTGKYRLQLRSRDELGTLPYAALLDRLAAVVPAVYLPTLLRYPEPTVLVEYRREHFVAPERPLRVTLDYGLVYYDQTGKQRISTAFGRRHEGLVVLEGKLPVGCERELRSFLQPFGARIARCSKYVHGCQRLGLLRE